MTLQVLTGSGDHLIETRSMGVGERLYAQLGPTQKAALRTLDSSFVRLAILVGLIGTVACGVGLATKLDHSLLKLPNLAKNYLLFVGGIATLGAISVITAKIGSTVVVDSVRQKAAMADNSESDVVFTPSDSDVDYSDSEDSNGLINADIYTTTEGLK